MNILMSSYACEPGRGSEPGVGWNWACEAAKEHEVWVLTRQSNRQTIESFAGEFPQQHLHFIYHDLPKWARWWKKGQRGLGLYYLLWQLSALPVALREHRAHRFDIVHHVTFNSIDMPGMLWLLPVRFIWGPVGGAQEPPPSLSGYFGSAWRKERLRIWRKRLVWCNPTVRAAAKKASVILAANQDTERALRRVHAQRIERELETAVGTIPWVAREPHEEFNVVWAGQFIRRKAPGLAIDVIANLVPRAHQPIRLIMIGDGPLHSEIQRLVIARGLERYVFLPGRVSYGAMNEWYQHADAFLFTSLHDTSGNVVLEAMSHALPVVTLDHHGAAEMVANSCGIKVPVTSPEQVVTDFADALAFLAANTEVAQQLGMAGRRRVMDVYDWTQKGARLCHIYRTLEAS